ncbi:hypothetical protein DN591_25475 [Citrobacter freundii]|nr:hypothetical protein DN591_25475 [Citrobacter freundii]
MTKIDTINSLEKSKQQTIVETMMRLEQNLDQFKEVLEIQNNERMDQLAFKIEPLAIAMEKMTQENITAINNLISNTEKSMEILGNIRQRSKENSKELSQEIRTARLSIQNTEEKMKKTTRGILSKLSVIVLISSLLSSGLTVVSFHYLEKDKQPTINLDSRAVAGIILQQMRRR